MSSVDTTGCGMQQVLSISRSQAGAPGIGARHSPGASRMIAVVETLFGAEPAAPVAQMKSCSVTMPCDMQLGQEALCGNAQATTFSGLIVVLVGAMPAPGTKPALATRLNGAVTSNSVSGMFGDGIVPPMCVSV